MPLETTLQFPDALAENNNKAWYGPQGFTVPVAEIDLRVGGRRLVCMEMQTPDGAMQMWTTGAHTAVVPHTHLAYTESQADEHGAVVSPETTEVTVDLAEANGRTAMILTHAGMPADSGAGGGWGQAFDKLAAHIETVRSS